MVELPAPFGEKLKHFLDLPFRAGFRTVPGRAVESGGKGWQTADTVHLCYHYPVGLGEAGPQNPTHVTFCTRNVEKSFVLRTQWTDQWCMWCSSVSAANAMDGSVVHVAQQLGGGMSVRSRHRFRLTLPANHAETRPRPMTGARLSKEGKNYSDAAAVAEERLERVNR